MKKGGIDIPCMGKRSYPTIQEKPELFIRSAKQEIDYLLGGYCICIVLMEMTKSQPQ